MFIVFEGIDGSGKTTIARSIAEGLEKEGKRVYLTEEPTKTWLGEAVRRGIEEEKNPYTQALLFFADRAEHVREIKRKLGKDILYYQIGMCTPPMPIREPSSTILWSLKRPCNGLK